MNAVNGVHLNLCVKKFKKNEKITVLGSVYIAAVNVIFHTKGSRHSWFFFVKSLHKMVTKKYTCVSTWQKVKSFFFITKFSLSNIFHLISRLLRTMSFKAAIACQLETQNAKIMRQWGLVREKERRCSALKRFSVNLWTHYIVSSGWFFWGGQWVWGFGKWKRKEGWSWGWEAEI